MKLREVLHTTGPLNISDDFEAYTTGIPPTAPWVNPGAGTPPSIETHNAEKKLKIQGVGYDGKVAVDISGNVCTDSVPVHVSFVFFRPVQSAAVIVLCGINEDSTLANGGAFSMLRITASYILQCNTPDGWMTLNTVQSDTNYIVDLYLYDTFYQVGVDGVIIGMGVQRKYPGNYESLTHGYFYFPGTADAAAITYINDFNYVGEPTAFDDAHWTNRELGHYANEGVAFFRQVLNDKGLQAFKDSDAQNITVSTVIYSLPADYGGRIFGATISGNPISLIDLKASMWGRRYYSLHSQGANLLQYPIGWIYGNYLEIYPVPTGTVVNALVIYYMKKITEMNVARPDSAIPELPEDLHYLLIDYVAMVAKQKYNEDVQSLRANMDALATAANMKYMQDKATTQ